ncbi:hypothetical protein A3F03_04090 [Candidatus Roizmanbacteria bacterium RIFCSPHIGHO2_12_FULL_41_11]|uniref:SD-repeat containing protein B domain-containing protein n=3 Tax=Candidatus Roizmaniibacteriota TaxID=1752723 RepID=A0A1F7JQY0_9BACT|nr:MAG: hypothetical protein A3F03_04090 [Candidatus Roizmanbacteria bacterium RIFCSPHIGHO2_12_FULL_41_11]OGK51983.1 MAG: hypothetical protein A2966_04230 [Candidatus Roizmanbacteria bacterium RIFCSPLOWO2_01_FULL_41_22]OGK58027.1 MAG: hypothetical protein A3H86_01035 [Candidatus Roizmanbacteria bacterium RIFCSPLOWO2_02_FULL_41_9]
MEQHPVPRQITTFEFKLIGFMTLKQFLYMAVFAPLGFIVYKVIPIPFLNVLLGVVVFAVGAAFAFIQIQDRPMDVFLKNLIRRLRSPTQFTYHKQDEPALYLKKIYFDSDPHIVMAHIDSQAKLSAYLAQKNPPDKAKINKKAHIQNILRNPGTLPKINGKAAGATKIPNSYYIPPTKKSNQDDLLQMQASLRQPYFTGVIKNNKQIPLPGVLVYVKDQSNNVLRLLKTNPHGIFASYSPLPTGDYVVEIRDPNEGYFFDTMKIELDSDHPVLMNFYSKEIL